MNLTLDIGNNYFKIGIYKNSDLIYFFSDSNSKVDSVIDKVLGEYKDVSYVIISNVSSINTVDLFNSYKIRVLQLNSTFNFPFKINYKTPLTLGNDRLALASAASLLYPKSNKIIIDVGTCITIDFIDYNNIFFGGSISPGIDMRYKSLNNYTANLPLLEISDKFSFPGDSTETSIHSGVIGGVCNEINGFIDNISSKCDDIKIILTGGNAKFLSKTLKISIFANQNFILDGLNSILNLNKE
jgi:type III pantothenate kinase